MRLGCKVKKYTSEQHIAKLYLISATNTLLLNMGINSIDYTRKVKTRDIFSTIIKKSDR